MSSPEIEAQLAALAAAHGWSEAAVADVRAWVAGLLAATRDPAERETVLGSLGGGAPDSAPTPLPATDRFEFRGSLGAGAMGEVYRVWDRGLRRNLAMKTLRADRVGARGMMARFVAEAQLTAQLRHPAIVAVHELGHLPDGRLYYTMREIRGSTLGDRIAAVHRASGGGRWGRTEDGWTLERLLDAFAAAADAVAHAHARGVVHRDLKPANVMIGEFDEVQVLDWGVAKLVGHPDDPVETDREDSQATLLGDVVGTPGYLAPEQAYGWNDRVDARSDVYALGSVLYELLSGRPPYAPQPGRPVLAQVLEGPPAPVGRVDLPAPSALVALCEGAMARDRAGRPADAAVFAGLLAAARR